MKFEKLKQCWAGVARGGGPGRTKREIFIVREV